MNNINWCLMSVFVQVLPDEYSRDMCLRFADMESKLGEIDRARAIYSYCSQICDPRVRDSIPSHIPKCRMSLKGVGLFHYAS